MHLCKKWFGFPYTSWRRRQKMCLVYKCWLIICWQIIHTSMVFLQSYHFNHYNFIFLNFVQVTNVFADFLFLPTKIFADFFFSIRYLEFLKAWSHVQREFFSVFFPPMVWDNGTLLQSDMAFVTRVFGKPLPFAMLPLFF